MKKRVLGALACAAMAVILAAGCSTKQRSLCRKEVNGGSRQRCYYHKCVDIY